MLSSDQSVWKGTAHAACIGVRTGTSFLEDNSATSIFSSLASVGPAIITARNLLAKFLPGYAVRTIHCNYFCDAEKLEKNKGFITQGTR